MNIVYLSTSYVPARRASSVQVMKMCSAMARLGHHITLLTKFTPERLEGGVADDFAYYGVDAKFDIVKLQRPRWKGGGVLYLYQMAWLLQRQRNNIDLVFSRSLLGAYIATWLRLPVLFEAHDAPQARIERYFFKQLTASSWLIRLVTNSRALLNILREQGLVSQSTDTCIAHNGADVFALEYPQKEEKTFTSVGYIGSLYRGRGIEIIEELARRMPTCRFQVVGGTEKDLSEWKQRDLPDNFFLHGFVEPGDLPKYYARFDVLLMPYQKEVMVASGRRDTSQWMCPLKMFEYMAASKPIISSDLPVLHEVLTHEYNALMVNPDDVTAWQSAIERVQRDKRLAHHIGQQARQDVEEKYTWDARAQKVLYGL